MTQQVLIELRDSLEAIPAEQWNALCSDGNPFLRHEFLHTLDVSGCLGQKTGWYPRYFLMWDREEDGPDRELLGAVPAYLKTNSYGEFVFDWAWAEAFERHQLEYYPKLVCSIPFTPATGRRILVRPDQPQEECIKLLAAAIIQFADTEEYSSVHYLFLTAMESRILSANTASPEDVSNDDAHQDQDLATQHLRRIDCQYHWHNAEYTDFEDFLARCNAKRRKTIRRERRYVSDAGIRLEQRLGNSLSEQEWVWVHDLYQSTYDRKWGNPSLTQAFFIEMAGKMGDQVLIVFAYDPNDHVPDWPVACSIMFIGSDTLYGRYWGCRSSFNALHFEACYYQGIDYCIANGISHFEPGAQGEHKITRGFVPTITQSAHHIRHPGFREAIANFLSHETPHVQQRCTGLTDLLPFKSETISL